MDELKAIWKLVNDKLADNEWTIGYLRGEIERLTAENQALKGEGKNV